MLVFVWFCAWYFLLLFLCVCGLLWLVCLFVCFSAINSSTCAAALTSLGIGMSAWVGPKLDDQSDYLN